MARILLADDGCPRTFLRLALAEHGHTAIEANNSKLD